MLSRERRDTGIVLEPDLPRADESTAARRRHTARPTTSRSARWSSTTSASRVAIAMMSFHRFIVLPSPFAFSVRDQQADWRS